MSFTRRIKKATASALLASTTAVPGARVSAQQTIPADGQAPQQMSAQDVMTAIMMGRGQGQNAPINNGDFFKDKEGSGAFGVGVGSIHWIKKRHVPKPGDPVTPGVPARAYDISTFQEGKDNTFTEVKYLGHMGAEGGALKFYFTAADGKPIEALPTYLAKKEDEDRKKEGLAKGLRIASALGPLAGAAAGLGAGAAASSGSYGGVLAADRVAQVAGVAQGAAQVAQAGGAISADGKSYVLGVGQYTVRPLGKKQHLPPQDMLDMTAETSNAAPAQAVAQTRTVYAAPANPGELPAQFFCTVDAHLGSHIIVSNAKNNTMKSIELYRPTQDVGSSPIDPSVVTGFWTDGNKNLVQITETGEKTTEPTPRPVYTCRAIVRAQEQPAQTATTR